MRSWLLLSPLQFSLYFGLLLSGLLATVFGQGNESGAPYIRIEVPGSPVEFGKEFSLRVIRSFDRQWQADPWQDQALAPLEVRLLKHEQKRIEGQVTEVFEYSCYCFLRGLVTLPVPELRLQPIAGGPGLSIQGKEVRLRVSSALPAGASSQLESLQGLFPAPFSWRPWVLPSLLVVLFLFGLSCFVLHAKRKRASQDSLPVLPPDQRALQMIEDLRRSRPSGFPELREEALACSNMLRLYVETRFAWTTRDLTTEELLSDPRFAKVLSAQAGLDLRTFLEHHDAVKFAGYEPDTEEREGMLQRMEDFIRGTSPIEEPVCS